MGLIPHSLQLMIQWRLMSVEGEEDAERVGRTRRREGRDLHQDGCSAVAIVSELLELNRSARSGSPIMLLYVRVELHMTVRQHRQTLER